VGISYSESSPLTERFLRVTLSIAMVSRSFLIKVGISRSPLDCPITATGPTLSPEAAAQAVARCKQGIQAQANLSASAKAKLEATCEKTVSGDQTAERKAVREACVELVNASHLSGAARERALSVCRAP